MSEKLEDKVLNEIKETTEKIRNLAETQGTDSAEFKRYVEESKGLFDKFEKHNDTVNSDLAKEKEANTEMKERIENLENAASGAFADEKSGLVNASEAKEVFGAMLRGNFGSYIMDSKNEQKAKNVLHRMSIVPGLNTHGAKQMIDRVNQFKALPSVMRSDIGETGGFLAPTEFSNELMKLIIETSPIRSFAKVRRTSMQSLKMNIRTSIPKASRPGQTRAGGTTGSGYGQVEFTPSRMTNTTIITQDDLQDSAYDLVSEIMDDNRIAFGVAEGAEFVNGDGVEEYLGFTEDDNIPEHETLTTSLTFDDVKKIAGKLKSGYDGMYFFNRSVLTHLSLLKDLDGRYLWNPFGDAATGIMPLLNGLRYSSKFADMDNETVSGGYPMLFAEMNKFYQIVDRTDLSVIKDELTLAEQAEVKYTMHRWTTGRPLIKEAGVRMKRKA